VTVLDDYSGYAAAVPVRHKGQAAQVVQQVVQQWEVQLERSMVRLRTDRGGEYMGAELQRWMQSKGVTHKTTAPYSPQSNGKAERLNHTLWGRVRACLSDAQLPLQFWGEAVKAVAMVRNMVARKERPITPHQLMRGIAPDVSGLRVYGCTAWVRLEGAQLQGKSKAASRAVAGVLVGYEASSKQYRVAFPKGAGWEVRVSRSVLFDESVPAFSQYGDSTGKPHWPAHGAQQQCKQGLGECGPLQGWGQ
jgi:transposase InsO family protein